VVEEGSGAPTVEKDPEAPTPEALTPTP
jgi:hypothetical protein